MTKIAINGLGRIGRAVFKQLVEDRAIELVAVNDLASSAEELASSSTTPCMAGTDVTVGGERAPHRRWPILRRTEREELGQAAVERPASGHRAGSAGACSSGERASNGMSRLAPSTSFSPRRSKEAT
jgi:hypothetical protein